MGKKLTDKGIRAAQPHEKPYKLYDADGLFLLVNPNGSKYWRYKYRFRGKEKQMSLGVFDPNRPHISTSLADARSELAKKRKILDSGKDPSQERKRADREKLLAAGNTFEVVAKDWWTQQQGLWTENHANRVWDSIKNEVLPHIGDIAITEIEAPGILAVVRRVESRGALDVARRVLQRCNSVFKFAVQTGRAKYNPVGDLSGVLQTRKVQHRASVSRDDLPELLRGIDGCEGDPVTRHALQLLMLTFVRPGELRGARWEEFDLQAAQWSIPAERIKMKTEHLAPLSRQALELVEELAPLTDRFEILFPGNRSRHKPISENTMTYALYRIGFKSRATPHGMRATASSILNEQGFNHDAIERQLSHLERNKVRGAYTHHAEYPDERRRIMQWWADYLEQVRSSNNMIAGNFGQQR
jgi:integrase